MGVVMSRTFFAKNELFFNYLHNFRNFLSAFIYFLLVSLYPIIEYPDHLSSPFSPFRSVPNFYDKSRPDGRLFLKILEMI